MNPADDRNLPPWAVRLTFAALFGAVLTLAAIPTLVPEVFRSDSETLLSGFGDYVGDQPFYRTFELFSFLEPKGLTLLTLCTAAAAIHVALRPAKSWNALWIAAFMVLPGVILFLPRFQKETLVLLITLAVAAVLSWTERRSLWYAAVTAIYIAYGVFIREYYLVILAAFIAMSLVSAMNRVEILACVVLAGAACFLLPRDVFWMLQSPRDHLNVMRFGIHNVGDRTAFLNAVPPLNAAAFFVNYAYAAAILNVPFPFFGSVRDLVPTAYVACIFGLMIDAARRPSARRSFAARLVLAHMLTLWIGEPDVGSYLRHLASVFVYICLLLPGGAPEPTPREEAAGDGLAVAASR